MQPAATKIRLSILPRMLAVVAVCLFMASACSKPQSEPEEQVRQLLAAAQDLIEAKQRSELLSMVSEAYSDADGNDRYGIGNLLRVYFLRQNSIKLITSIDDIRLFGDTAAEVDLTAGLAGSNDRALGFSASAYQFEFEFVKEGADWMLVSARWGRLGEDLK